MDETSTRSWLMAYIKLSVYPAEGKVELWMMMMSEVFSQKQLNIKVAKNHDNLK